MVFRSTDLPDYSADGPEYIVFRENDRGVIAQLHAWGATYERISWAEQAPFHLSLMAGCLLTFIAYGVSLGLREVRRRTGEQRGLLACRLSLFVALSNILFIVGLPIFFAAVRTSAPMPASVLMFWLAVPLASLAVTALLPGFAALAWLERWWTRGQRIGYSTFVVFAIAFMTFLNYWKLLGIRR
jgi:hypothetical protein